MSGNLLNRAFELAKAAIAAESAGEIAQASDLFLAAIQAFHAVALTPEVIKDDRTKTLIKTEIARLQERRGKLLSTAKAAKVMETRFETLTNPHSEGAMRERLLELNGLAKPAPLVEDIAARLKALKEQDLAPGLPQPPPEPTKAVTGGLSHRDANNLFLGEDWKRGLDEDVIKLIEQARDETFL